MSIPRCQMYNEIRFIELRTPRCDRTSSLAAKNRTASTRVFQSLRDKNLAMCETRELFSRSNASYVRVGIDIIAALPSYLFLSVRGRAY